MQKRMHGSWKRRVLLGIAAILVAGSCNDDPTDGDLARVVVRNAPSAFAVQLADARTGQPLSGVPVTLRISGAAAARVIDVQGLRATHLTVENGFVALGLTGAAPTPAAPAELLVLASAEGYLETSRPLTLTAGRGGPAIIHMVALASPPPGVAVGGSGAARAGPGGVLESTVTVPTALEPLTGGRATVTLRAGAVVRDASGAPLSGALQTTIVYFNNRAEESLVAFPGGFGARVVNAPAGIPADGVFTSAGYTAITVRDGSGREASTFSAPLQVTLDVPAGTVSPETGLAVKNGDAVPYWSYQPATGQWRYEGRATLAGSGPAGNFTTAVEIGHLSYLNLDWKYARCSVDPRIDIIGNVAHRYLLYVVGIQSDGGMAQDVFSDEDSIVILGAPAGGTIYVEARDLATGRTAGRLVTSACPGPGRLQLMPPILPTSIIVRLRLRCDGFEVLPWGWVEYRRTGTGAWLWGAYLQDGEGVVRGLDPDTRYEVKASIYAGEVFSGTRVVRSGRNGSETHLAIEFQADPGLCARLKPHDQGGGAP